MKAKRQRKLEECRRQLASIEKAQNILEKKGVELEKQIRLQEEGTYATAITGGDGMTVIQWSPFLTLSLSSSFPKTLSLPIT